MIERLVSQEVIAAGTRADYWLGKNEERWFFGLLFHKQKFLGMCQKPLDSVRTGLFLQKRHRRLSLTR